MKLKVPPALQVLFFGLLMWAIRKVSDQAHFNFEHQSKIYWLIFSVAILIGLAAVYSFKKARTTVDPLRPEQASSLVIKGLYKYSRNPNVPGHASYFMCFFYSIRKSLQPGRYCSLYLVHHPVSDKT